MSVLNAILVSRKPARVFAILGVFYGTFAAYVPEFKETLNVGDAVFGTVLLATALGLSTAMIFAPLLDRKLGEWGLPTALVALGLVFFFRA